tara:strand:- start:220 stop:453 length:234 start_codon:yes stop_codon:yes gene_type:complete
MTPEIIYFSATTSVLLILVGGIVGWLLRQAYSEHIYVTAAQTDALHPEMYDDEGYRINDELLRVRFVELDDEDAELE